MMHELVSENDKARFFTSTTCKLLTEYAKKQLGPTYRVLIGEPKGGSKKYLLVKDQEPVFEHPRAEDVAVKIDMLWLAGRDWK